MVQDADGQNCICPLMSLECIKRVRLSNCLWKSIPGWNGPRKKLILKCVNRKLETLELSMGWPLAEFCGRGTVWYSCGTSTSPFVILYVMVSLLWSLRVCRDSHPRSDTIADTETGGLLRRKGMFFINRAARRCVISSLSIYFAGVGHRRLNSIQAWDGRRLCKSFLSGAEGIYTKYVYKRKPNMRFAAALIWSMCWFQRNLLFTVTPR